MNKTLPAIILVLIVIVLIVAGLNNTKEQDMVVSPSPTAMPKSDASLPEEYTSGNSRFSQGVCTTDEDCMVSGCSAEVCGSEEAMTTCEYSEDFPNEEKYDCECVNNVCGWTH